MQISNCPIVLGILQNTLTSRNNQLHEIEIPSWTNLFNRNVCTRGLKTKKEISDQISLITGIDGCLYFLKFENKVSNYFFFFKTKNNDYFVKLIDNYQLNKIQSFILLIN